MSQFTANPRVVNTQESVLWLFTGEITLTENQQTVFPLGQG